MCSFFIFDQLIKDNTFFSIIQSAQQIINDLEWNEADILLNLINVFMSSVGSISCTRND